MKKNLKWKALLVVAVIALCSWAVVPPEEQIKLGLDLKGGIHLIMRVNTIDALDAVTDEVREQLMEVLDDEGVGFADATEEEPGVIVVSGVDSNEGGKFRNVLETSFASWDPVSEGNGTWRLSMRSAERAQLRDDTVIQAVETIRRRVDALGVAEPLIAPHGDAGNQILVQLPGFEDVDRAKAIIKETAKLELKLVEAGPALSAEDFLGGRTEVPGAEVVFEDTGSGRNYYLVERVPVITGRDLKNARPSIDQDDNSPSIDFTLKPEGASRFRRATRDNVGRLLAIILDGQVHSAPRIESAIFDRGQITGRFTQEEARDLALTLRSGALPASLEYQEERTVGPSLGADSIRSGVLASITGLAAVVAFILIYYRLSGVNAVVALALNLLILLGAMAYFAATLTLPGIAGVILTIGIGVDANVLIFERIKEEMRGGKTPRTAISAGFGKAFWTIFDANVTSLLAAAILFQFGTGPVQGFAVTLSIGLLANMFSAIFVSRFIFDLVLGTRRHVEVLSI